MLGCVRKLDRSNRLNIRSSCDIDLLPSIVCYISMCGLTDRAPQSKNSESENDIG